MKVLVSLTLMLAVIFTVSESAAQEKKAPGQAPKTVQKEPNKPEMIDIVTRIVRGARMESQDAKNVSFTLKPTSAFITIQF